MSVDPIIIHKGRTEKVTVYLPYSVAEDTITSQIRTRMHPNAALIAEFDVSVSDNGKVITLTLDDSITANITRTGGFMDIKRVTGGEPVTVLPDPIPVVFKNVVTQ